MKRNKVFLFIFPILLSSCSSSIEKINHEMQIYIASDLHLYSSNLIGENNVKYTKDKITSDGRVQEFDYELVKEFVKNININKPDYVFLTGDLSYNGEKDSHVELIKLLDTVNKDTKVLVIPGNHDTYQSDCFNLLDDKINYMNSITSTEFKELYSNYGYSSAYSYDEETLSYIYELSDDKWVLMLDTTLSRFNYEMEHNYVGGQLLEPTYKWIESNLKYAYENNIEVISSTHHNLITVNKLFENSYTLYESNKLLDLYEKYGVKLNFSGHLHIQSIKNKNNVYDIASNSLLDYGNRYGILDIYENCYDYYTKKCILFDNFTDYSFSVFYKKYYDKTINNNINKYGEEEGKKITDFISKVNCYYFDGNYEMIYKLKKENRSIYRRVIRDDFSSYIKSLFDIPNNNQHFITINKD